MNVYLGQLTALVDELHFEARGAYRWCGVRSPQLAPALRRTMTADAQRELLRRQLQAQLYRDFYCQGGAPTLAPDAAPPLPISAAAFVARLSAANSGAGQWQPGWREIDAAGRKLVTRDGLAFQVDDPADIAPGEEGTIKLRLPRELLGISPGFYMALGDRPFAETDLAALLRVYFNVNAEGAVSLLRLVTEALNSAQIPFRLKVVNSANRYTRADAAVLYLRQSDFPALQTLLRDLYAEIAPALRPAVPALTKKLLPGIGLAEDAGGGESFGLGRCLLLADGLLAAHDEGIQGRDARLDALVRTLNAAEVSCDTPYLRPGGVDNYDLDFTVGTPSKRAEPADAPPDFLGVALGIGRQLVREAIWHEQRCTWIGAAQNSGGHPGVVYRSLGPYLYDGSAGIALFLAELAALNGDEALRRTALGALCHAVARLDAAPADQLALYTGALGVAVVATRCATLLRDDSLVAAAARIVVALPEQVDYDLLSGAAGAIIALLLLRDTPAVNASLERAIVLGDWLMAGADRGRAGWSWPSRLLAKGRDLTGLAHGASGIGLALLELAHATGAERFRQAADAAFSYERHLFDPVRVNWPDFRVDRHRSTAFVTYWCHGAPGIALARLRAYELSGDPLFRAEAAAALATTNHAAREKLALARPDFSLCHGLAGNAEVLLQGVGLGLPECDAQAATALHIAASGALSFSATADLWPCGTGAGDNPSLLLGRAGIGLFYLRLAHPATPSPLLLRPPLV